MVGRGGFACIASSSLEYQAGAGPERDLESWEVSGVICLRVWGGIRAVKTLVAESARIQTPALAFDAPEGLTQTGISDFM